MRLGALLRMTGREIRRLRGSLGMTQAQFGQMVHAAGATVSRWERDRKDLDDWHRDLLTEIHRGLRHRPDLAETALQFVEEGAPLDALSTLLIAALAARN